MTRKTKKNTEGKNSKEAVGLNGLAVKPDQPTALTLDLKLYEGYLEDCDLTEDQKHEFIETLWNIVVSFVDMGFELHPLQQVGEKNTELAAPDSADVVKSNNNSKDQLNVTDDGQASPLREGSPK